MENTSQINYFTKLENQHFDSELMFSEDEMMQSMENNTSQIISPKLEQQQPFDYEGMFWEYELQRSLQMPLLPTIPSFDTNFSTSNLLNNALNDYQQSLFTQQNLTNGNFPQNIMENNNFLLGEVDLNSWDECPPLCDDTWKPSSHFPSTTPITFDANPNSINLEPTNDHLFLYDLIDPININDYLLDQPIHIGFEDVINVKSMSSNINANNNNNNNNNNYVAKPKIEAIQYEEIRKYFDMPISKAAKELNVGLTVLKKRCRELNIKRWPHRKIKSLESLISNVKDSGRNDVVQMLEELKRKLRCVPGLDLTEDTKKLRQACFKANYKKRRAALNSTR